MSRLLVHPVAQILWGIMIAASLFGCESSSPAIAANSSRLDQVLERAVLKVGIRADNPPHSYIREDGQWVGFDVDVANAIARYYGVALERVKVDELTRISFLQNGRIDIAIASISHTHKRDQEIDFSQTYFWSIQTFIVRNGTATSLHDLVGEVVGFDRGSHALSNWTDWLQTHGYTDKPQVVEFSDKRAAIEAVKQGTIAGWAEDLEVLASFAQSSPELTILTESIGVKQDGIGLVENDSTWRDAINIALQELETSGQYDIMYDRWFGPASNAPIPLQSRIEVWPNG